MKGTSTVSPNITLPATKSIHSDTRAYWQLSKPRVTVLVWLSALAAVWLPGAPVSLPLFVFLALGTWLVVASANGLNEVLEWQYDAQMPRTANRPIPSGRLSLLEGLLVSAAWGLLGVAVLWHGVNPVTSLLGAFALLTYVFIYTPSKRRTAWCTVIGAVPGAIPPVMGWTAVQGQLGWEAAFLFLMQFVWQFPHFWAIAWKYGREYREAGFRILPFEDYTGYLVGWAMFVSTVILLAVSVVPTWVGWRSGWYALGSVLLGMWMSHTAWAFARQPSAKGATRIMLASLGYLPLWFGLLLLAR